MDSSTRKSVPWFLWPLAPFAFAGALVVMLPLGLLALVSIPYYLVYPDRHAHLCDFQGNDRQKQLLAAWRARYRQLGFSGRVRRAIKLWRRRRGQTRQRLPLTGDGRNGE